MVGARYLVIIFAIAVNVKCNLVQKTLYIETTGGKYFQIIPIDWFVTSRRIKLKIQALQDASFAFLKGVYDTDPLFEIVFGGDHNKRCFIRKNKTIIAIADTPGVLDPHNYRGFWISWFTSSEYLDLKTVFVLRIGHEGDNSEFLAAWDSEPNSVDTAYYIGVRTNPKTGYGFWELNVLYNETNTTTFNEEVITNGIARREPFYDIFYRIVNQRIEFKVKTPRDAFICLSNYQEKSFDSYQIVLGGWGNTKCVIMKDYASKMTEQECYGACNAEYYRGFWVSLEYFDDMLVISVGNDGEILPFMKYVDFTATRLKYYSVGSTGNYNKGYWILKVTQPSLLKYVKTENTNPVTYKSYDPIPKSGLIPIKTTAKRDAWVGLTSTYSKYPEFEIIIGGWNNKKSTIRRDGKDLAQVRHNNIIDTGTHFTGFWITARQEKLMFQGFVQEIYLVIQVGQEDQEKPFLQYNHTLDKSNPMQLNFYSVGSTMNTEYVEWILEASVQRIDIEMPKYYISYDKPTKHHLYILENQRVEFEIKTAKNAIISLTTSSHSPKIEVSLFNGVTKILKDGNIKAAFYTNFNLSNEVFQGFWIDWNYISEPKSEMCLRFGHQGDASILFEWRDPEPFLIKYIGVDTQNYIGYWKFYDTWIEPKPEKSMPYLITHDNPKHYQFFPITRNRIRFKVQSSRDANLVFTTNAEKSKPILEVLLGAFGVNWQSQYTYIRRDFKKYSPAEIYVKTPNIIRDNLFVGFWINWEYIENNPSCNKTIMKMNLGLEGEEPFLTWQGEDIFPINYVGVTSYKSTAVWNFQDDIEVISKKKWKEVTTFDNDRYTFLPIVAKPLRLHVKTSNNALIALATTPTDGQHPFLECKIGTENNTKTMMLLNGDKQLAKYEGDTIGVLSDTYYESFWLDWNNYTDDEGKAKMAVFLGRRFDHNHFASLIMNPFDINFVGITTVGDTAFWNFEEIAESLPPFVTTYNHKKEYQFYIAPIQGLTFSVKASSDAYIALSTTNSSSDVMYEIMIGVESNRKSYIRKNREIPKDFGNWTEIQLPSAETENILSSTILKGFWIEWIYKNPPWLKKKVLKISVGRKGEVHPFLRWHDTDPLAIKFIGFTGGNDKTLWKFEEMTEDILPDSNENIDTIEPKAFDFAPENYTQVMTSNFTYQFFSLPGQKMSFKVKTQSEIYVVLSSKPQLYNLFPTYEILIGARNKITWIKKGHKSPQIIIDTPLILNVSEFRGFWVSWFDGNIDVGFIDKAEPFMRWTDPDPLIVNFIGITSHFSAVWQITDSTIQTYDDKYHVFPIAADKTMFLLKASDIGKIKLTTEKDGLDPIVIEVILGSVDNTGITFQRDDLFYTKNVSGVLERNNFRGFWLSWALGQFTVGLKGEFHPLAFFDDPKPSSPNYIGFSGKNGTTTTWQFKVAPVWKPLQWDSNNDNPCFLDPVGRECADRNLLLQLKKERPTDNEKRLVNDCDNDRWSNAFQCNKPQ